MAKKNAGEGSRDEKEIAILLKDTEEYLKELSGFEDLQDLLGDRSGNVDSWVSEEMQNKFISEIAEPPLIAVDGYAELHISEDEMTAYASFYPPQEGGNPLLLDSFEAMLRERGIKTGVQWKAVEEALFTCNSEVNPQHHIPVALGKEPSPIMPAHYIIKKSLVNPDHIPDEKGGRVDYREVSPFIMVSQGETLATLYPKKDGSPGLTVLGGEVPPGKKEFPKWRPGRNCEHRGDAVVAVCSGRFLCEEDSFEISEVLLVNTDVGYETGNIDFKGDIILKGEIKDNFRITSGGSVFCEKTMDASVVECKKDLIVKQGIIGRNQGKIIAGGKIRAKFIENCYLEARDSIQVDVAIMNSSVYCAGAIEMYKRGVIVGGTLYAQNGVKAMQLGTEMGPRTEIYCGIDYSVSKKLEWIQDKNLQLVFTLQKVEAKLKKDPANSQLLATREKIKTASRMLGQSAQELVFSLDKNDEAEVIVRGAVFPGIYVEICHISYVVNRKLNGVKFRLDKSAGRIVVEQLTSKTSGSRGR